MPTTFEKAPPELLQMAEEVMSQYHEPLKEWEVKVDYLLAHGPVDEDGETVGPAMKERGLIIRGKTKIITLKDRAKGHGDAEIILDGDWWGEALDEERRALLDHELYHLRPTLEADDLGRPKLKLRRHDFEVGWFAEVAKRHGTASQERQQAKAVMDKMGQYFWPDMVSKVGPPTNRTQSLEMVTKYNAALNIPTL